MSFVSNIFGSKKSSNPAAKAMPYLENLPNELSQYYDPYIQQGSNAGQYLAPQYQSMATMPAQNINDLLSQYQASPAYQYQLDESLRAAGNTAAAGGYRGDLENIKESARIAEALSGDDMYRWLGTVLGQQQSGLAGSQGLYDAGMGASFNKAGDISNIRGTQAQLAFQGQREKNAQRSALISGLLQAITGGAGSYMGYKAMTGGL